MIGSRKEIIVAMDWTDFDADKQATIQISLVTSHARATPLLWKTVSKKNLKNKRNDYEDELLCRFKEVLPPDVKVTVLTDRGFGDNKLYDFLKKELGFDFVIRFRGNIIVENDKGESKSAQEWVDVNGRAHTLRNAKVTALSCEVPTVVCVKAKGCHYYEKITRMTSEELKKFLDCLLELLDEHKNLKEILWVI